MYIAGLEYTARLEYYLSSVYKTMLEYTSALYATSP